MYMTLVGKIIYYGEINLICIVVALLLLRQMGHNTEQLSTSKIAFDRIILMTVLLCMSDAVACISSGMQFPGARVVVEISNQIYFETMVAISYQWLQYVRIKLNPTVPINPKSQWLWAVPLLVVSVMIFTNPLTHYMFSVGEHNLYARGPGVVFHWIVMWTYLLGSVVLTSRAILREKRKHKRREMVPLLLFIIAPVICGLLQMLFYGVTSTQVGITISILIISLSAQGSQVLTDALTGLNNRRAFDNYLIDYLQHHAEDELSLAMLDINNFKMVNDKFGHMSGDRALQDTAEVLKQICAEGSKTLFLCRYGGDEFLIAGMNRTPEEIDQLKTLIRTELAIKTAPEEIPYTLEVGIGLACGKCADMEDAEHLLRVADEAMYEDKKRAKRAAEAAR